jgi:hypothetical protein
MKGDISMSTSWEEELRLSEETEDNLLLDIINWKTNLYTGGIKAKVLGWRVVIDWEEVNEQTN